MHPFGGEINIGATADGSKYYIVLNNVPQGPCVNLASMNFGTSLAGAGVGSKAVAAAKTGSTGNSDLMNKALTPALASGKCNTGPNEIAFLLK